MLEGEPDIVVAGEARDGLEALELAGDLMPDLVILDVRMPRLDGLGAARAIRDAHPQIKIVIVTMHESVDYLEAAVRAGASGYVLKDASRREILTALRAVIGGEAFLNGALARDVIRRLAAGTTSASRRLDVLTAREIEVLGRVAQGLTNKEIARHLAISPGTVKVHVEHVISKLGVADRTQAAVRAVEQSLVRLPPLP
jgi:DNA-binding NarL/FixJ family response regulator